MNIKNRLRYAFTRKGAWVFVPLFIILGVVPSTLAQAVNNCDTAYSAANFTRGGVATDSSGTIMLTPNSGSQFGAIWNKSRVNLSNDFCVSAEVYLGADDYGADGLAFVMQPNSVAAGSTGGGLGYAGITPSFAVEYDTYYNGGDLYNDHVGLMKNGNVVSHNLWGVNAVDVGNIEDNQWRKTKVYWDSTANAVSVWLDKNADGDLDDAGETLFNAVSVDLEGNFSGEVYWGFTAATGGATNLQQVRNIAYTGVARVNTPPTASTEPVLNNSIIINQATVIPFVVADDQTTQAQWSFTKTSSNTAVVPLNAIVVAMSSATNGTITITPAAAGSSTVVIGIQDADGSALSYTLSVDATPPSLQVTSLLDDGSSGTLRWAITQANATSGGIYDAISFDADGVITLTSALPQITQNLTVTGNGRTQTVIDGNNLYRPFNVASGRTMTISNMTLKQGQATNGGLIFNGSGTVVATNIRFTGMTGGSAVFNNNNGSTATYTNCTFDYLNIGIAGDYGSTPQLAAGVTTWANEADSVFTNKTYVVDSVFSNNTHGINNYRFTKVQNSQFTNNSYGANVTGLNRTQILNSTFTSNGIGIYHNSWIPTTFNMGTDNRLITGNTFTNNSISMYLDDGYNNGQKNQSWVTITSNSWDAVGVWVRYYQWNGTSNAQSTARPYTTGTVFAQSSNTFPDSAGDPTNLTVTQSGSNIVLDWDAPVVSGYPVERYAIFFTTGNLGGWGVATGNVGDANALNTGYTFSESFFDGFGVESGSTWRFKIRSDNDTYGKYSQFTSEASIAIGTPPTTTTSSTTTTTTTTTTTVPVDSGPVDTSPIYTEPVNTNPVYTEPINTEPVYTEPIDTNPVDTEPIDTEPVYTDPIDTDPVYTEPIDTDPVDTEPIDTEPVYTEPIDTDPVDTIDFTDEEIVNIIDTIDTTSSEEVATVLEDIFDSDISTDQLTEVLDAVFTADVEPEVLIAALDTVLSADISTEEFAAVLEAVFDEPLSDEQFTAVIDSIITEDITDEQFAEVLNVLESDTVSEEQVADAVDAVLENGVTESQATDLASSSKVLESIDTTQAEAIFETIPVGELTQAEEAALVAAVTDAPQEIKETFEETIDIYGEGLDDYVAVGSQVDVGSRRTLIAASTAFAAVAGAAATGGPSGGSTGGSGGSTGGSGGSNTEGRSRREEEGEEPAGEIAGPEDDDDGEYTRNSIFNYYLEEGIWKKKISWLGLIRKFVNETAALSFTLAGSVVVFITLSGDTRKTAMIATGVALAVHYIHVLLKNDES